MISGTLTVSNRLGLHARAATRLVNCASGFDSEIRISRGSRSVNGKSIMGVLTLAAAKGTDLSIDVDGPDEADAYEAIRNLIEERFGEED
jgi:phosphocarrier protein